MTVEPNTANRLIIPVVTSKTVIAIPSSEMRTEFSNPIDIRAIKAAADFHNYLVIATPKISDIEAEMIDGYYKRAAVVKILLNTSPTSSLIRLKFVATTRCDIISFNKTDSYLTAEITPVSSVECDADTFEATLNLLKKETVQLDKTDAKEQVMAQKIDIIGNKQISFEEKADSLASIITENVSERFKQLLELNPSKRLELCLCSLRKQRVIDELEIKIDENVRKSMTDAQKEYYLREKMRAIQEELGDKGKRDQDIEDLRNKIKSSALPKQVEEKALRELNRYILLASNSPESNIIKTYLDFLLSLPWSISSEDSNDINKAKKILDEDHYGLEKVKNRILEYLAVKIMTNRNPQTIICLVGPPGVGKTSLAKSIARALNKKFVKQSLGGVKDESEIRGHRRTYIGALPGRILQSLAKVGTNNPVFLLDEIDKMSSDYKGDPTSAMLEVLDPEQNRYFSDNYLEEAFDLSNCFFIATANYLGNIPAPLRDRLEIVELSSYTEYEKFEIAKAHLIDKQLKANGLDSSKFKISDQAIYTIIQKYTREAGVRELERLIGSIIRKSIKKILMDGEKEISIDVDNLYQFLGQEKFDNNSNTGSDLVGVVTGLAYTEFGGDTLQIEVTHYKGNGHVILTGKLGDVMKESAETALSFVKTNAENFGLDYASFKESDIHIHVPEGAVPKDGPSAGVTMVTSIVSSFANRKVDHLIGMTGEITLRGRVLPIGGLREKSIAALRSGLKKILIPKENVKDMEQIPDSVKNSLEIIPIETAFDAIKYALK